MNTKAGGEHWKKTMHKLYGKKGTHEMMQRIGAMGGAAKTNKPKGFASDKTGPDGLTGHERAALVGAIGGLRSSRAGIKNGEGKKNKK